jgi:hypothetical protein
LLATAVITTTLPAALAPVAVAEGAALVEGLEGLRYVDEVVGKGPQPFEGDVVKVNYEARLAEMGEPSALFPCDMRDDVVGVSGEPAGGLEAWSAAERMPHAPVVVRVLIVYGRGARGAQPW